MSEILFSKADIERSESSALKRENQSLVESCDSLEKSRQKLAHDLGIKEQQVSSYGVCVIMELKSRIRLKACSCVYSNTIKMPKSVHSN